MELNTRGRYAVMAMADLAKFGCEGATALPVISERQKLSISYLEQIFGQLRHAGLVESVRGRAGGYRLARPAAEISVAEVMRAVAEETRMTRCVDLDNSRGCLGHTQCLTHGLWHALGRHIQDFLGGVSLQDVVDGMPQEHVRATFDVHTEDVGGGGRGMTSGRTYLDYNATVPLRPQARAAVERALDVVGNPSSVHQEGRQARRLVEDARESVAALVGARPSEVVFTSGATEANVTVLRAGWDAVAVSAIEHDSVLAPARASQARTFEVGADRSGVADASEIAALILSEAKFHGRRLVSLQAANNETGVIQPIAEVAAFCRAHDVAFHTDAVQIAGRRAIDFEALGADFLSVSAHKIGGPMGVGALVIRDGVTLSAMVVGGGQERRRRSGTENIAGIAGFGAAAEVALRELADMDRVAQMRDRLEAGVRAMTPDAVVMGAGAERIGNTSALALAGQSAETLVIRLDLAGIAVSAGSACSSGKVGASHVLAAMGLPADIASGAIRISLGWNTTEAEIDTFLGAWQALAGRQRLQVA